MRIVFLPLPFCAFLAVFALAPPRCLRVLRLLLRLLGPAPIAEALPLLGGAPSAEPVTDVPGEAGGTVLLLLFVLLAPSLRTIV